MNRAAVLISILLIACFAHAQQDSQYSQFMLNGYGINPAAGGYSDEWEVLVGRRKQWIGFPNGPVSSFMGVSKSIAKKYYRNYWHGAGMYVENDDAGLWRQSTLYLSYTFHLRIAKRYTLSFGMFGGGRLLSYSSSLYNPNDPALSLYPPQVLMGPVFIPGIRVRSLKGYADFSVHNIYKNRMEGRGKMLGTPSELQTTYYLTLSKRFVSESYYYSFVPSLQLRYTAGAWPAADANCMVYYKRRIGVGLSYRPNDAAIAMLHIRVTKNVIIGFAYDYILSRMRTSASSSQELMFGFSPISVSDYEPTHNVAECPTMEF